ncbi:hypothetical protein TNCV_1463971 [Trichonephila clavipes]|nr:hypothetical protein TNCV_1463971 [Trichonephila clavipes]
MIVSRNVRKIWKRVVLYHVLKELTLPTGLCFPASREGAGGRSINRRMFVEDDSKVFYGSGPWNRVVLNVDWRWFSCVASCGEEDCFSFCRVYGDFPFVVPVL